MFDEFDYYEEAMELTATLIHCERCGGMREVGEKCDQCETELAITRAGEGS